MSSKASRSSSPPFQLNDASYDSDYEGDGELVQKKKRRKDLSLKPPQPREGLATKAVFREERGRADRVGMLSHIRSLTAYDRHKMLVNEYFMSQPGALERLRRDGGSDRRDIDVIRENHRFLWEAEDEAGADVTWGRRLARKYYDKLFKEYAICDLRRYQENKVGLRWRVEKEVVTGKGQFECGSQHCTAKQRLRTWEVNFGYVEHGEKRNALVKIRLCPDCSAKLNFHHQRREVTKKPKKDKRHKKEERSKKKDRTKMKRSRKDDTSGGGGKVEEEEEEEEEEAEEEEREEEADTKAKSKADEAEAAATSAEGIWREPQPIVEEKSRDEEFEEYLEDLFL